MEIVKIFISMPFQCKLLEIYRYILIYNHIHTRIYSYSFEEIVIQDDITLCFFHLLSYKAVVDLYSQMLCLGNKADLRKNNT